jgi:ABC-2 type transport system ATP-binding protein
MPILSCGYRGDTGRLHHWLPARRRDRRGQTAVKSESHHANEQLERTFGLSESDRGPDRGEPEPLIVFEGIWRHWGKGQNRWPVLRGVDLECDKGTATRIEGKNGAGKTTLLRIGTGILAPDAGTVTVDGLTNDQRWSEYHKRIGFLSAGDRGLYPRFSVRGHLEYVARISFIPKAERDRAIEEMIRSFELAPLLERRADRLSQGQRQRLRLALTFIHQPKALLLDEPRNSLDSDGLHMLTQAVEYALQRGAAVVWCSPTGEDQPISFDRDLVIEDGRLRPKAEHDTRP